MHRSEGFADAFGARPRCTAGWASVLVCFTATAQAAESPAGAVKVDRLRQAYYGDLHLHTRYSFDAYLFGTAVTPEEAYRFARGETLDYLGEPIRRREPLDFLAVSDHAESIGIFSRLDDPSSRLGQSELGKALRAYFASFRAKEAGAARSEPPHSLGALFLGWPSAKSELPDVLRDESASAWQREIDAANRYYQPGKFTTFIAYEWTPQPNGFDYHRNIIFKGRSAPYPFTAVDSNKPEELWTWLDGVRAQGHEVLAIPHNANTSGGLMYQWVDSNGQAIDAAYARQRQANEPLSEISQKRGTSETHPLLSPDDEFASHEIVQRVEGIALLPGSYVRDALSRGLVLQRKLAVNPYKYGFAGGSDLHGGLSVSAQADFGGNTWSANLGGGRPDKHYADRVLAERDAEGRRMLKMSSGSLTGVWAESNTRESIFEALRRKETFATSGTRLRFRFFGGWTFGPELLQQANWLATAYEKAVPMGGDLPAKPAGATAPSFAIWAVKDPNGANLDRVQVVKVWEEEGLQREKVFEVAWSGDRKINAKTGKLPAVENTVELNTGRYTNSAGTTVLQTVWQDPEFNPELYSAYYLRVLEIPTPRWSTLLAIQTGLLLPKNVAHTIQQRGWSSPVWYSP